MMRQSSRATQERVVQVLPLLPCSSGSGRSSKTQRKRSTAYVIGKKTSSEKLVALKRSPRFCLVIAVKMSPHGTGLDTLLKSCVIGSRKLGECLQVIKMDKLKGHVGMVPEVSIGYVIR